MHHTMHRAEKRAVRRATRVAGASVGKVFDTDGACRCPTKTLHVLVAVVLIAVVLVGLYIYVYSCCAWQHVLYNKRIPHTEWCYPRILHTHLLTLLAITGLALGGTDEHARFSFQSLVHDPTTRRWHALVGGANGEGVPWLFAQVLKPMRPIQLEQYALSMARFASGL